MKIGIYVENVKATGHCDGYASSTFVEFELNKDGADILFINFVGQLSDNDLNNAIECIKDIQEERKRHEIEERI